MFAYWIESRYIFQINSTYLHSVITTLLEGLPEEDLDSPNSPVHRARKFSTVFGTTSPKNPISI